MPIFPRGAGGGDVTAFAVGSYTGNGAATRDINIGFTPDAVIVVPETSDNNSAIAMAVTGHHSLKENTADIWFQQAAYFQGIVANGFRTGTDGGGWGTNTATRVFFWIAFQD